MDAVSFFWDIYLTIAISGGDKAQEGCAAAPAPSASSDGQGAGAEGQES